MNLEKLYLAYKKLNCTFDPFYQRDVSEFQQLVDAHSPLSRNQIQDMISILKQEEDSSKKYFVMDFLKLYKEEIPHELYEPVFDAGIRHRDPSFNRLFFIISKQMKGPQAFMEDIIRLIKGKDLYRKIKAIDSLYWNFHLYWSFAIEDEKSYEKYVRERAIGQEEEIYKILNILMREFQKSRNFLVRYMLATYLPKYVSRYPEEWQEEAQDIIAQIKKEGLPFYHKATKEEFQLLWKKALENEEIGSLFFDQLKWRKREANPESES